MADGTDATTTDRVERELFVRASTRRSGRQSPAPDGWPTRSSSI